MGLDLRGSYLAEQFGKCQRKDLIAKSHNVLDIVTVVSKTFFILSIFFFIKYSSSFFFSDRGFCFSWNN